RGEARAEMVSPAQAGCRARPSRRGAGLAGRGGREDSLFDGFLLPERDAGFAPLRGIGPAAEAHRRPLDRNADRAAAPQRARHPRPRVDDDDSGPVGGRPDDQAEIATPTKACLAALRQADTLSRRPTIRTSVAGRRPPPPSTRRPSHAISA